MDFSQEIFATRLSELRELKGVRQKDVADAVGVSSDAIYTIEKGKRLASLPVLVKLATYFGVTTDYLLGRVVDDPPTTTTKREEETQ